MNDDLLDEAMEQPQQLLKGYPLTVFAVIYPLTLLWGLITLFWALIEGGEAMFLALFAFITIAFSSIVFFIERILVKRYPVNLKIINLIEIILFFILLLIFIYI